MNQSQYTTLLEVLAVIPDPRKARGQRYAWTLLLTLLAAGLASGQQTIRAIAQWVHLHADTLRAALPLGQPLPSEATLLRTIRQIDVGILEAALAQLTPPPTDAEAAVGQVVTPCGTILQAQAVDGKTLRGTTACGAPTHLVSLVQHGRGTTLAQDQVAQKRNEITAVPRLLAGRDLTDTVVTMDALLTQRALAQQIIDQGGHYLMIVKRNQPLLHDDLALFFDLPAIAADHEQWDRVQTVTKGHGRIETRTLERTTGDCAALGWPGAAQMLRRTCERTVQKTGKCTVTVTYGITSVPPAEADAALLETLWRGHWTIESQSHYVRDVTLGEDRNHMRMGRAPQALAALRNGLLVLWRRAGWSNIADAVRAHAASVPRALAFIGVPVTLT
jgi:predicted transposase YbfD/YdcC